MCQEASHGELIGKIPTKDPNLTEVVYLTEMVRCLECQQTVPMGIEVVTVKKSGKSRKAVRHVATAADMALITKRRRKISRFAPMLTPKRRCSGSVILPGG